MSTDNAFESTSRESVAIQQAMNTQVKQQAAIQTPTQQVMPSQKLGYNATPLHPVSINPFKNQYH